jgi:protein TonB
MTDHGKYVGNVLDLGRVSITGTLLTAVFCVCAAGEPDASTAPASQQSVARTPPKLDRSFAPRIGDRYYPAQSKRLGEQGKCLVKLTIEADGTTRDASIAQSTGYPRLDEACLRAFVPGKFIPVKEDGKPVEATWVIPITWKLIGQ